MMADREVRHGVGGNRLSKAAVTNGVGSDREWGFVKVQAAFINAALYMFKLRLIKRNFVKVQAAFNKRSFMLRFKSLSAKRSSVQPFKPHLINAAWGYIKKKKKKKKSPDGSIAMFSKTWLQPNREKRSLNTYKCNFRAGL